MSQRRLVALGTSALLVSAFATRTTQSLGYDELFTVWVSQRPWGELIHQANLDGFTPPLFYALVKLFALGGLNLEQLRVLPILFAGVAALAGFYACERLFGSGLPVWALVAVPSSAYVFTFAHELRPYSALLACALAFLGQLGGHCTAASDRRAGLLALTASAFSYLGLLMVVLWVWECRSRRPARVLLGGSLLALILSVPGLLKASALVTGRIGASIVWSEDPPALSTVFLGLAPVPLNSWVEMVSLVLLGLLLIVASRQAESRSFAFLVRAFFLFVAMLLALDAVVRIGFAPRYFVLPMSALLLLIVGVLSRARGAGPALALLLLGMNGVAISCYLTARPAPRADWREAIGRLEKRLGAGGVLLGFPFHHTAVAAHAYAPGLKLGGGYTSRSGPVFWYDPPASFRGYSFEDLRREDDLEQRMRALASTSDLCILSDEPDVTKTEGVFETFARLDGVAPFDTGDPRLRASCRSKA